MGRRGKKRRSKKGEGRRVHDEGSTAPIVGESSGTQPAGADHTVPDEPEPPVIDLDVEPHPGEAGGDLDDLIAAAASAARAQGGGPGSSGGDAPSAASSGSTTEEEKGEPDEVALGPVSTPEARQRLLSETLAHAAMKDARYRVPIGSRRAGRIKATVALVIFAVAGFVALVPPSAVRPDPPARLVEDDHREGALVALLLQAQQVEAFRVREQRVPASLAEVSGRIPGVRFIRSGNRAYQLVAYTPDGEALVYDSAAPDPAFASLDLEWWRPGGS